MKLPDDLWELPHRHVGQQVLRYRRVRSTNEIAAQLSDDLSHAGAAVLADEQTAGRGQYGRTWQAPPGTSVLLSTLLFPPPELRRASVLTAWAAVSVAEAILHVTGLQARIKWPNDILLGGLKVCGVLIEQGRGIIAGIGLNVNQTSDEFVVAGLPQAGSLAGATGCRFDTMEVARTLLAELDREYDLLMQGELATLEACWKWRLGLLGREVIAETFDGTRYRGRLRECAFGGLEIVQADGAALRLEPEQVRALTGE
jgi:BirA family transcriptional regulator, biotin operon repressor / biotin---[acetyl-CoA-carboxylase] ligase